MRSKNLHCNQRNKQNCVHLRYLVVFCLNVSLCFPTTLNLFSTTKSFQLMSTVLQKATFYILEHSNTSLTKRDKKILFTKRSNHLRRLTFSSCGRLWCLANAFYPSENLFTIYFSARPGVLSGESIKSSQLFKNFTHNSKAHK